MSPPFGLSETRPPVYTVAGLAAVWGVSDQFIYDQIRRGHLRAMRFGGKLLRVRLDAVEEYERQASLVTVTEPQPSAPAPFQTSAAAQHGIRLERRARPSV